VISFNDGAKRYDRVKGAIRIATLWAVGYTAVIWLLIFIRPGMFIRIFSSDDALVQEASYTVEPR
jgi:Na+-driven multidrug efflux pump